MPFEFCELLVLLAVGKAIDCTSTPEDVFVEENGGACTGKRTASCAKPFHDNIARRERIRRRRPAFSTPRPEALLSASGAPDFLLILLPELESNAG